VQSICASYNTVYHKLARLAKGLRLGGCCATYNTVYWHQGSRQWRSKRGDACCCTTVCMMNERGVAGGGVLYMLCTSLCTISSIVLSSSEAY
jgi:hypothetical protein